MNDRREQLINRIGSLDVAIGELLTFAHEQPLTETERQIINHHARDLIKVSEALLLLSTSKTNDTIKKNEKTKNKLKKCQIMANIDKKVQKILDMKR